MRPILWAGLNLTADDLAGTGIRADPLELVHSLTLTWLFAAQRSDEIVRLRVGCTVSEGTSCRARQMQGRTSRS